MASGFTLGNRICKRMGLPPLGSLFSILPQFYRFPNSHCQCGHLTEGAFEGNILPTWKYLEGGIALPGSEERVRAAMESGLNPEQTRAVQDFMMFLGERMGQTNYQFEHTMHCSPEEVRVLYILAERSPLMVKEIARGLQGVAMSKLTRLLDQLEEQGYISRSLNLEDRRTFHLTLTQQRKIPCEPLTHHMTPLTPH